MACRIPTQPIKLRQLSTTHYHTFQPTAPHLTLSYPNAGFVKNKAETTHQIRPKRLRAETTLAEKTQGRNDSWLERQPVTDFGRNHLNLKSNRCI